MESMKKGLIKQEKVTQKKPRGETKGQRPKATSEPVSGAEEGKGKFTIRH